MMKQLLQRLETQLNGTHPFVVYCKPGINIITGIFQKDSLAYPVDFNAEGFVFAPFDGGDTLFIPVDNAEVITAEFLPGAAPSAEAVQPEIDADAKHAFETLVSQSIAAINEGRFEKVVCSRTEFVPLLKADIAAIYENMLQAYPNAFRYCFFHPDAGFWMGATPEQLLKAEGDTIHTVALAGTQLYNEGRKAVWHEKEKQEQLFVTDYIVDELKPFAADIKATEPYTFRAGNIVHIKTDISATIKPVSNLEDVVEKLHPTPAVCGLPRAEAMQFLQENEGYSREYYSGYLGEVSVNNRTNLFVNLRCMKITGNTAQLFIGCGVTRDSDPSKEFTETVNKSITMRRVLL